jgi:hypothetical protein
LLAKVKPYVGRDPHLELTLKRFKEKLEREVSLLIYAFWYYHVPNAIAPPGALV